MFIPFSKINKLQKQIPAAKLDKLRIGIRLIVSHRKIKLPEVEYIVGIMAFCPRAIHPGMVF